MLIPEIPKFADGDVTLLITHSTSILVLDIPSSFGLPWGQLTRLRLFQLMTPLSFNWIIFQCPHLVHASFSVDIQQRTEFDSDEWSPDLFTLAHLVTLRLSIQGVSPEGETVENTIRRLVLPSMRDFELYVDNSRQKFPLSPIFPPLHTYKTSPGSAMSLTRLVLVNTYSNQRSEFASMLCACTALETLAMQFMKNCSEEVLAVLLQPTDTIPPPSLPSLAAFIWVIDAGDTSGFALKLNNLVQAWTSNPARCRPFGAVTIYALGEYAAELKLIKDEFREIKVLLGPWREGRQIDGCVAIAHSGMVLRTRTEAWTFTLTGKDDQWCYRDWPQE
ncbi:hypothetical protein H0H81_011095 [Sphagnurus paluster]|uniref:Uncharacterized protein n=1 Tax=Sphagnurus paluster TaxID=117069 RepID=A0A9P7FNP0_9AGAR|nr:hypothetical protein H0H81_011095 [Sphagnurus paluster]